MYIDNDYAVEDSPAAFKFFKHLPDLKVLVYDRPWNRGHSFRAITSAARATGRR